MENIAKRLNAYIITHPFDPGDSDCETVLDQLIPCRQVSPYFRTLFTAQTIQSAKILNTHIKLSIVEIG